MLLVSKLKAVEVAVLSQDELQMGMQKLLVCVNSYIQRHQSACCFMEDPLQLHCIHVIHVSEAGL